MALEGKPNVLGYLSMAAAIAIVLGYLVRMTRLAPARATVGVTLVSALMLFLGFREASGRHGPGHQDYFFLFALPLLAWFAGPGRRPGSSPVFRSAVLVAAVVLTSMTVLPQEPRTAFTTWGLRLQLVVDPAYQTQQLEKARTKERGGYRLSTAMRDRIGTAPVQVDPTDVTLAWVYDLNWHPAPVFQSFSAYTADLDERNARWLANAPADQVILRAPTKAIDQRNKLWDTPRYLLTELCDYRVDSSDSRWMILSKTGNRCGAPVRASTIRVRAGQHVVPPQVAPDELVTMSFTADKPGVPVPLGRLLVKSFHPLTVSVDGSKFRLPRALATGPLLDNVPAATGWPRRFGGATAYRSVAFNEPGVLSFDVITVRR
jgi:hypothetical protein